MLAVPEDRPIVLPQPSEGQVKIGAGAAAAAEQLKLQVVLRQSGAIAIAAFQMKAAVGAAGFALGHNPMAHRASAKISRRRHQLQQIGAAMVAGIRQGTLHRIGPCPSRGGHKRRLGSRKLGAGRGLSGAAPRCGQRAGTAVDGGTHRSAQIA